MVRFIQEEWLLKVVKSEVWFSIEADLKVVSAGLLICHEALLLCRVGLGFP